MVYVDFANVAAEAHFRAWLQDHRGRLDSVGLLLAEQADEAHAEGEEKPLAAVFDIDEILLCNVRALPGTSSPFRVEDCFPPPPRPCYPEDFPPLSSKSWPRDEHWAHLTTSQSGYNPELPGARELLETCRRRDVSVFLVTGREERLREETIKNFEILGLLGDHTGLTRPGLETGGQLYMYAGHVASHKAGHKKEGVSMQPFKETARAQIAETHCILVNLGDQLSDLGRHGREQRIISHPFYFTL